MGFRMIEPWKNPRSKFLWFRRRVPERFVALMGRREIKFSLGITDLDKAQLLCAEENVKLERMWQDHAAGRPPGRELDYRQVVALAGEFYKETVEKHRSNPGKAADWESSIARDRTLRQLRSFPLTPAQHRRFLFGEQVRAFLESKNLTLAPTTFDAFVKEYLEPKTQAESVLARNARGDFSPDRSADRFPEWTPMSDEQRLPKMWKSSSPIAKCRGARARSTASSTNSFERAEATFSRISSIATNKSSRAMRAASANSSISASDFSSVSGLTWVRLLSSWKASPSPLCSSLALMPSLFFRNSSVMPPRQVYRARCRRVGPSTFLSCLNQSHRMTSAVGAMDSNT